MDDRSTTVSHTEESSYFASAGIHHKSDSQLVHFLSSPCRRFDVINKPHVVQTSLGHHLDQTRKNYKSTKRPISPLTAVVARATAVPIAIETDIVESTRTNVIYTRIERTHKNFMDSSGRFPVQSRAGNEYILAMYNYDGNYIHVETMKRGKGRLLDVYKRGHAFFTAHGCQPKFEGLDTETSTELEEFMKLKNISYQYVPPNCKRRNAAERALRSFKNHFIATLCTVDKDFPLQLWDTILPQTELSLNILRGSRLDPRISTWEQPHGKFDFYAHPIVPLGMRIVLHEKPHQRGTWAPHGVEGFYLGPAL
jgi:hypothetical protein